MAGMESVEESFRVRVNLERFFEDERARCLVRVRGARRVRWLARRLRRLFPLPRRLALLSRGHLLPPDEPLALLQPDDTVEVIPATVNFDQTDGDIRSATEDEIRASTPEPTQPSPDRKRRRKDHQPGPNNFKLTDPLSALFTDIDTHKQKNTEHELAEVPSLEFRTRQKNKRHGEDSDFELPATRDPDAAEPAAPAANNIDRELNRKVSKGTEESDSERMRLLKEQALAALDEVAAAPRRRVRVRRRRKRGPPPPLPAAARPRAECSTDAANSVAEPAPEIASSPVPLPASGLTAESTGPQEDSAGDTSDAPAAGARPEVVRNPAAAPRAARLVYSLVDVAPV